MKQQSKSFFEAKDKETKISGVVFQGVRPPPALVFDAAERVLLRR
jgi:hypothetical protein